MSLELDKAEWLKDIMESISEKGSLTLYRTFGKAVEFSMGWLIRLLLILSFGQEPVV